MSDGATAKRHQAHLLQLLWLCRRLAICSQQGSLVADEVDGAAHVDVNKIHVQVLVQQLRAAPHGVWKSPAHLQCIGVSPR